MEQSNEKMDAAVDAIAKFNRAIRNVLASMPGEDFDALVEAFENNHVVVGADSRLLHIEVDGIVEDCSPAW